MIRALVFACTTLCAGAAVAQTYNPGDNEASSQTPAAAFAPPADPSAAEAPAAVAFSGSHAFRSLQCRGGDATVSGHDNRLKLSDCSRLTVSGADNSIDVTLSSPGEVTVSGARNAVTYRAPADGAPRITDSGRGNVVRPTAP